MKYEIHIEFGDGLYEKLIESGFFSRVNVFPTLFDLNATYKQLKQQMHGFASAFSSLNISESDFFTCMGDFFWGIGFGRCVVSAYALAEESSPLPDKAVSRMNAIKSSPFCDKMCVITGELFRMERSAALFEIRKRGGLTSDNPVNSMNLLILGEQEWSAMNGGVASRKVQKAVELQKKGKKIEIISENDFYHLLEETPFT